RGTPGDVGRFFTAAAGAAREILALLGARRPGASTGPTGCLQARRPAAGRAPPAGPGRAAAGARPARLSPPARERPAPPAAGGGGRRDARVRGRPRFAGASVAPLEMELEVTNADRAVGAGIAGELARRLPAHPLPPRTLRLTYRGSAGQSFGAFCVEGMRL